MNKSGGLWKTKKLKNTQDNKSTQRLRGSKNHDQAEAVRCKEDPHQKTEAETEKS